MLINSFKALEKQLKESFEGPILIFGQEKYLIEESIKAVYKGISFLPELNVIVINGENCTSDSLINACETLPVMAEKKLVHIKNPDFLKKGSRESEDEGQAVQKSPSGGDMTAFLSVYINTIPEYTILLMTMEDGINERNKVATIVKSTGYYVQYSALKGEELYKWIQEMFGKSGKDIAKSEIMYLISQAGTSTEHLEKEIEKLCSYAMGETAIARSHIDDVVHRSLENSIFKMVDGISRKDADSGISILNVLLMQKEKPLIILSMIIRQYRLLLLTNQCMKMNLSQDAIGERIKLKGYPLQNMMKQSRAYNEVTIKRALNMCLDTDFNIKNGKYSGDDIELALEMLIVELCK